MNRRQVFTGILALATLTAAGPLPVQNNCTFAISQPEKEDQWGRKIINKNPTHAEVNVKTGDVRYHFHDGRQVTINALATSPPDPQHDLDRTVQMHLWKMSKHYYQRCGGKL